MVLAYDHVIRSNHIYCPSGEIIRGKPRTRHRFICLQLSSARCVDNGGVIIVIKLILNKIIIIKIIMMMILMIIVMMIIIIAMMMT